MIIKKIIAFGLVSVLLFTTTSTTAFAEEGANQKQQPKVVIGDTSVPVPDYIIQDIIKENPDAGQINITECRNSNINNSQTSNQPMALAAGVYYTNCVKTQTSASYLVRSDFVISVSKGQTVTIGHEWKAALSCSISGGVDNSTLGITGNLECIYSASSTFVGPPESSSFRTRNFYVKFYEVKGTYTATCHDPFPGWYITYPVNGSYTEPAFYLTYNIDMN